MTRRRMIKRKGCFIPLSIIAIIAVFLTLFIVLKSNIPTYRPELQKSGDDYTIGEPMAKAMQKAIDEVINKENIPGLQVYVKTSNDRYWSGQSGTIDLDRKIPVENTHLLRIASITKTYTAAVLLRLTEEGLISLDDPVSDWFPEFERGDEITIENLLNHSSGIYNYTENFAFNFKSTIFSGKEWTPGELIDIASGQELSFDPGTDNSYSNTNYILLGLIAEYVTGKSMNDLYNEYIFIPLNLKNTHFVTNEKEPDNLISGYHIFNHEIKPDNKSYATGAHTAGAIVSNAKGVTGFFNALFNGKIISDSSLKKMTDFKESEDRFDYGLGLLNFNYETTKGIIWGHPGGINGFLSIVGYSPEKEYIISILGNTSSFSRTQIFRDIQDIIDPAK